MSAFSALIIGHDSLALNCARMLREAGHQIRAIVTRHAEFQAWAEAEGIARIAPGAGLADRVQGLDIDWLLSIANLEIIPDAVLARAGKGAVNFHDGPLPRYAGLNAPVWAILNDEPSHGVTWHRIAGGIAADGRDRARGNRPVAEYEMLCRRVGEFPASYRGACGG